MREKNSDVLVLKVALFTVIYMFDERNCKSLKYDANKATNASRDILLNI